MRGDTLSYAYEMSRYSTFSGSMRPTISPIPIVDRLVDSDRCHVRTSILDHFTSRTLAHQLPPSHPEHDIFDFQGISYQAPNQGELRVGEEMSTWYPVPMGPEFLCQAKFLLPGHGKGSPSLVKLPSGGGRLSQCYSALSEKVVSPVGLRFSSSEPHRKIRP